MRLFLHLLLNAVHDRQTAYDVPLKRGQYFTSYRQLQEDLDINVRYITESIRKLKQSGEIETERCRWGTIFTVLHYDDYQGGNSTSRKRNDEHERTNGNGIGRTDF
jgi:DNA-binding transcriptional regulator YhcF (GntR family)